MRDLKQKEDNFSGNLLVARPSLLDPNFFRTVILLSMHSPDEGAMGVILNRPTGKTIGEHNKEFQFSPISETPVYQGGPVGTEQFMLAAWRWPSQVNAFELHFGVTQDKLGELKTKYSDLEARCFVGHSGWSPQQLEKEIQHQAWMVSTMRLDLLCQHQGVDLWKKVACDLNPDLRIEVEAPDDPSRN
ncbi:MAG: YqgE/AlgH family protein [Opitutae bacterium]|nr:YqgE/AlgH family protein [Opitutae bacterium]